MEYRTLARFVDTESRTVDFHHLGDDTPLLRTAHALSVRGWMKLLARGHTGVNEFFTYTISDEVYRFLRTNTDLLDKGRPKPATNVEPSTRRPRGRPHTS
jgi:hypothetical protein